MLTTFQTNYFFNKLLYPILQSVVITMSSLYVYVHKKFLTYLMNFFKKHTYLKCFLADIVIVDYPENINRFKLVYPMLSYKTNIRLNIVCYTNEIDGIDSITSLYPAASWLEREGWDMFGICFFNHPDLRRIFTDYGFYGFALRKDFPLTGFTEIQYDFNQKRIITNPVSLSQEIRLFNYTSSWLKKQTYSNVSNVITSRRFSTSTIRITPQTKSQTGSSFSFKRDSKYVVSNNKKSTDTQKRSDEGTAQKYSFPKGNYAATSRLKGFSKHRFKKMSRAKRMHLEQKRKKYLATKERILKTVFDLKYFEEQDRTYGRTYLYYVYKMRAKQLKFANKFDKSALSTHRNSYRWSRFFINKALYTSLLRTSSVKNPFFKKSSLTASLYAKKLKRSYGVELNPAVHLFFDKYDEGVYVKITTKYLYKMLATKASETNKSIRDTLKKEVYKSYVYLPFQFFKSIKNNNVITSKLPSYLFYYRVAGLLKPYNLDMKVRNNTYIPLFNYYPLYNFKKRNRVIFRRSHKFPLSYLATRRFPDFMIVNYRIFSFCLTKTANVMPSIQARLYLKNYVYYPVWYKSCFIY